WARMAELIPASPATLDGRGRTIGGLWKRCCGLSAPVHPGGTCLRPSATGTRCSVASGAGRWRVYLIVCSRRYATTPILNTSLRTAPSFGSTSRPPAQKGGSVAGNRALAWRSDQQDHGAGGWPGQLDRLSPDAGTAP